jgi:hypothetical protein
VSAGGTGVVTGSPPNLVVLSNLNKQFGDNSAPLSYATWMGFAIPLMLCNTLAAWAWICLLQAFFSTTMSFNNFYMHKKDRLNIFVLKFFFSIGEVKNFGFPALST